MYDDQRKLKTFEIVIWEKNVEIHAKESLQAPLLLSWHTVKQKPKCSGSGGSWSINGSSPTILGRNAMFHPIREMPNIGGLVLFDWHVDICNLTSGDAIVEYHVVGLAAIHYWAIIMVFIFSFKGSHSACSFQWQIRLFYWDFS